MAPSTAWATLSPQTVPSVCVSMATASTVLSLPVRPFNFRNPASFARSRTCNVTDVATLLSVGKRTWVSKQELIQLFSLQCREAVISSKGAQLMEYLQEYYYTLALLVIMTGSAFDLQNSEMNLCSI